MASEEPLFDPTLKKKKKKKTVAFSEDPLGAEADPTTPAQPDDDGDLGPTTVHEQMKQNGRDLENGHNDADEEGEDAKVMFGDLKKKKKKKDISADLDGDASTPAADEADGLDGDADDLDFSELKKKKKSKKKKADLEAFEKELGEAGGDDEDEEGVDLDDIDEAELGEDVFDRSGAVPAGLDTGSEPWLSSDRDYTYAELLQRFYSSLHAQNPSLLSASGKRYTIAPPSIHRDGNKKSVFANVSDICKRMRRPPEHVIAYMFSEMGTTGSVDGAGRLVIKGRFQQKQIENVLRRYIVEYVTCKTCKSPDTLLSKENRIFFTTCESCGSRRSVTTIKSGFQAQVGRRSRNKTG